MVIAKGDKHTHKHFKIHINMLYISIVNTTIKTQTTNIIIDNHKQSTKCHQTLH